MRCINNKKVVLCPLYCSATNCCIAFNWQQPLFPTPHHVAFSCLARTRAFTITDVKVSLTEVGGHQQQTKPTHGHRNPHTSTGTNTSTGIQASPGTYSTRGICTQAPERAHEQRNLRHHRNPHTRTGIQTSTETHTDAQGPTRPPEPKHRGRARRALEP